MRNSVRNRTCALLFMLVLLPVLPGCHSPTEAEPDSWDPRFELHLSVVPATTPEQFDFKAVLINRDVVGHDIVLPGDGSLDHMRTPCIGWSVTDAHGATMMHPDTTVRIVRLRCGSINALRMEEIVTLQPGDSCDLGDWLYDWTILPKEKGMYRVVFYYDNRPDMDWVGLPLGRHDPAAMERVRNSPAFRLRSNEVTVNY